MEAIEGVRFYIQRLGNIAKRNIEKIDKEEILRDTQMCLQWIEDYGSCFGCQSQLVCRKQAYLVHLYLSNDIARDVSCFINEKNVNTDRIINEAESILFFSLRSIIRHANSIEELRSIAKFIKG